MRGETTMVTSEKRSEALRAIEALRPLNRPETRLLPHRDVSAALGTCRAPKRKPTHLTAKQRYEALMKQSFFIQTTGGVATSGLGSHLYQPRARINAFLANTANLAPLLRNEADRIDKIDPPDDVADAHHRLVDQLRAQADLIDDAREAARKDALGDQAAWHAESAELDAKQKASLEAIQQTVRRFQAHGYSIYVPPDD